MIISDLVTLMQLLLMRRADTINFMWGEKKSEAPPAKTTQNIREDSTIKIIEIHPSLFSWRGTR